MPATVPVYVLCDQGLGSRDLWAQIVALGWHPCLRYRPHITFQPEGQTPRVPVRSLTAGPGGLWVGTGRAFRDAPLASTLIVLHAYGQAQPWVLLTDTPVAQTEPTLYACRNWIEQGFRGLKTVGDRWSALARPTESREPFGRVTPESSRSPYSCQDPKSAPGGPPARQGQSRACPSITENHAMSKPEFFVGIDVAQPHLDVAIAGEDAVWRVSYDAAGLTELCVRLAAARLCWKRPAAWRPRWPWP